MSIRQDMDPFGIQGIVEHLDTIRATHETIDTIADLPKAFSEVVKHLSVVEDKLTAAQPKLQSAPAGHFQTLSAIAKHCSADAVELKRIFQALEKGYKQDQDSKSWATVRYSYLQALQRKKELRIECLMNHLLGKVKELCLHDVVRISTPEIENAINDLAEAGPTLDDLEFNQPASIVAQQTVNKGGIGQQNNPSGGENTFNAGYNISGGTVNFGHSPSPLGGGAAAGMDC